MRILYIYCIILISICSLHLNAQNFSKVDSVIDSYPKSFLNPNRLSERICLDFIDQSERVRAIYAWEAKNVKYDVKALYSKKKPRDFKYHTKEEKIRKEIKFQNNLANRTLRKKSAVCYGYAVLFKKLCDLCEIPCVVISGGDKTKCTQIGKPPSLKAHAWNSVRVNNSWKLVDVTWGSGTVDKKKRIFYPEYSDVYFFLSPEKFYLKHFPKDTSWVLINKTKDDFVKLPLFYQSYLKSNFSIISPSNGVISLSEKDTINFKFTNVTNLHSISYQFSTYQYSRSNITYEKEPKNWSQIYSEYEIVNNLTRNGYLTIFSDQKPIATYKILIIR